MARRGAVTRTAFRIHGWVGLITGVLLLNVGLTGAILVFAAEIDEALWPGHHFVRPVGERRPLASLYEDVRRRHPSAHDVGIWRLPEAADRTVVFNVGFMESGQRRFRRLFVDPYSGQIVGHKDAGAPFRQDPIAWIFNLHVTLLAGTPGYCAVGFLSLLLLVSLSTGIFVFRRHVVRVLLMQVPVRLRDWRRGASDLHRIVGVWAWLFNAVIAATGLFFMRGVFTRDFYRDPGPPSPRTRAPALVANIDALLADAAEQVPQFVPISLGLVKSPRGEPETLVLRGDDRQRAFLLSRHASRIWFDARTGHLLGAALVSHASPAAKLEAATGPLHFGSWGGTSIKMAYATFALAPPLLSITGFLLWLRGRRRP